MKQHKRKAALLILLMITGGLVYWMNEHRRIGWRDALSPSYWVRRSRGEDLYDPQKHFLFAGNRGLKEIALTIDDGPHQPTGSQILDILKEQKVKATFFLVGVRMEENPDLVRRMFNEGHEVANHTQHHFRLPPLKPEQIRREINDADIHLYRITGRHFSMLRPPGVQYNDQVLQIASRLGYETIGVSVAARDFEDVTPDFIIQRTLSRAENGSIILLHDDRPSTVTAMPRVISELKRRGFKFVTVSELMSHLPKPVNVESNVGPIASSG